MRLQHDAGPALPGRHGGEGLLGLGVASSLSAAAGVVPRRCRAAQPRRHCPDRPELVEVAHRDPGRAEPRPQLRDDARRQQRMAAEIQEEVVLDRHRRHLQSTSPRPATMTQLEIARRGHHVPARALQQVDRCRQLLAVDLAAGERRQAARRCRGTSGPCSRAAWLRSISATPGRSSCASASSSDRVGCQLRQTCVGRPRARPRPDAGILHQHRLDLGQLDAEAADLHLTVDAAEELERPSCLEADEVVGAVEPGPGPR